MGKISTMYEEARRIALKAEEDKKKKSAKYGYTEPSGDGSVYDEVQKIQNNASAQINTIGAYNTYKDILSKLNLFKPGAGSVIRQNYMPERLKISAADASAAIPYIGKQQGASQQAIDILTGMAGETAKEASRYAMLAKARSGDASVLDNASGGAYDEYARLLRLSGFDALGEMAGQKVSAPTKNTSNVDLVLPSGYDFNTFGDDIFSAKYGELKDGTKLTESERQMYKKRIEALTGIDDFDALSTSEQLNLTYDENYLEQLKKMNSGAETYRDVLDLADAYSNDDLAADMITIRDYHEGHVNVSEDDFNRAVNRVRGMTGANMQNRADVENAAKAYSEQSGGAADFSMDDYINYVQSYARNQMNQMRSTAEQAKFDDEIGQKYGQYAAAPDFAEKSRPVSSDINPSSEAEAIHEAIVAIDDEDTFDRLVSGERSLPKQMQKYNASTVTPEQRAMFNYLWNSGMEDQAIRYVEDIDWSVRKMAAAKTEEVSEELSEGVLGGIASSAASVLASPARAAVLPLNTARSIVGEDIDQYDPSFNVGRSSEAIRSNVGQNLDEALGGANIAGWNIGSGIYQGAMSVADNLMLAGLGAGLGAPVMGLEAADSQMRTALENGRTQGEALRDAYVTAGIEAATEKLPMETLFGDVGDPVKYVISNALSEAGEEVTSELVSTIYDQAMYGDDSDLGRLADELRTKGYAGDGLTTELFKEIVRNVRDAAFSGLAGGAVGAAPRAVGNAVENRAVGKNLQSNDAVRSVLDFADKVLPDGDIKSMAQEQLAAMDGSAEEGKTAPKVSNAKIGRIYREVMNAVDADTQAVLETTTARYINDLLDARGKKDSGLARAISRIVADNGTATREDYTAVAADDDALAVTEGLVEAYNKDMDLAMQAEDIASKAMTKTQPSSAQTVENNAENDDSADEFEYDLADELTDEELAAVGIESDEQIDAQVSRRMVEEFAAKYDESADFVVNAYEEGQDPVAFTTQFKRAYQYGEEGRNFDVISQSQSLYGLTDAQIQKAYMMGKGAREFRNQWIQRLEKRPAKVGRIDATELKGIHLNNAQNNAIGAMRRLAEAVGFNVKFVASKANAEGNFTEANGSWDKRTRTITIDINAGRISADDANYAMMQTAGHELTHFIKEFADAELWDGYQEFVFGHLSEKMTEAALDTKIDDYIKRWANNNKALTRDGAIEEIVADASGDALLKLTEADIQQMAESNPSLLKKIGDFIQRWVKKVKALIEKAYTGQTARNAIAEQMADAADELGRRWAELLKNAAVNARSFAVTGNGAVVSQEVADIMESNEYSAPDNGLLSEKSSIRETAAWARSHKEQYPDDAAFEQNLALVENFDRNVAADSVARYLVPHGRIPKTVRGPLRNNVEYVYTFDMDTKCERTYQFLAYRDAVQKRIGRQLTEDEARSLIELMRAYGQMIPCTYCYVEGKRMKLAELYMKYLSKNSESVMGQKYSAEEVFDIVETARSVVSGYLDNRFNVESNYTLDTTLASGDFAGYRDFEMPISEEAAAQEIYDRYNIADKSAKRVVAGFVAEWVYSRRMDVPQNLVNTDVDFESAGIDERVLAFHDLATKAAQGGAKAKGIENYEPYVDQLKNVSVEDKKYMVGMGGIRKHSSNDFQIQNVQDYMLFFMDLAADKRGGVDWTGHTYTKNLDYARIFAPTNDRINVSIAMYGDNTSGITPNTQEGVEWEELKQIRKQYKNVGAMAMVTNNDQLSFALNSSWIDMIIPFHASGMKRSLYYDVLAWTDYTSKQSERLYTKGQMVDKLREKGIKVNSSAKAADVLKMFMENFDVNVVYNEKTGKRVAPHFFPGETIQHGVKIPGHGNDAQRYFELCEQYGTNPRFFGVKVQDAGGKTIDVTRHPSYLKLIKETARTDTPQQPIVAKFDMDYVNEAMSRFRGYSNLSEDTYGIVDEFVREYAGKKRKVGYLTERARQYKEIRSEMAAEEAAKRAAQREELTAAINAVENEQSPSFGDNSDVKFSVRVTDRDTLKFLDNQETVTTYKTMQMVDGKLYPPMAAVVAGKYEDASQLGAWEQATERPDLIKIDKNGKPQFTLNKGKGKGSLAAAYNPYMHSSNLVLNDQFSGAYDRPNLVTVQCEVPVSELTSGYHAQYAKDSVGWHAWHTGTVAGALRKKTGIERQVLLSRWIKPVRIVPDAEVARMYKELLDGTGIAVPDNVVPPSLLKELRNAGVDIAISGRVPADMDYQLRDPDQISDRELLANVMESAAINEAERDMVARYRQHIDTLNEKQAELDKTNRDIVNARKEGRKADAAALKSKADILAKQIDREDGQLLKYEAAAPLKAVVKRQREALRQKARARTNERVQKVRQQEAEKREKLRQTITEVREDRDRKIANLREVNRQKIREVRDEKDESYGREKYRKRIEEDVKTLRTWVTSPTNKEHVPQFLRAPLGDMIAALDFSSVSSLSGRAETQRDQKFADALEAMNAALVKIRRQQEGMDQGAASFATIIDLPYGYAEEFSQLVQDIKSTLRATQDAGSNPIYRMKSAELKELSQLIRTLTTSIRQMNRLLANAKYDSAVSAARATVDDLKKMAPKKDGFKVGQAVGRFLDWTNTVPFYAFKRFGKGGQAIFDGLQDGWDKLAFNTSDLIKFAETAYNEKEVRAWSREIQNVKLSDGSKVRMTTAQLMSLYCLSKRAQAVGHLLGGGIRIADIDSRGKSIVQSDNYTLTQMDLDNFAKMLNARQKAVADKLQKFMSTRGSEWGNEVSMKRFGYEMFTEDHYFPIETDANNRVAMDEQAQENSLFRLLNMSATKGLVKGANNALVVRNIFDVFAAHTADMAKYNALGLPILDALKWLNYVKKTQNDDGTLTTESVQKSLERAYGTDARRYIINLLRDLNGVREGGRNDGLVNKMISNAKIASVAGNVRVYLLQATSMPRAAYAINPKYLTIGLAKMAANPRNGMKLATEKVGIGMWKSLGFYDTNISGNIREMIKHDQSVPDVIRKKTMAPAGLVDNLTLGVIYYAAEAEVAKNHSGVVRGGKVWDKLINDRVRDIVYRTQVVDSTMTRSDAMRGKGIITLATSFMSEPTLTMNMLADSIYDWRMKHRGADVIGHPTANIARAMAVFTFTAVLTAAAEALFNAERDDDEYETFGEKYMSSFIGDLTEADTAWKKFTTVLFSDVGSNLNVLNNIPFASDAMSMLEGYENSPMYSAFIDSFKSSFDAYQRWQEGKGTVYSWIYSGLKGLSQFSGLPVSNITREGVSVWNTFFADKVSRPRIQTYANTKKDAAAAYYEAIGSGDNSRAAFVLERARINGISEDDVSDSLVPLFKDDYVSKAITEGEARRYLENHTSKDDDEIDDYLNKWAYERDTGLQYSNMKVDYTSGLLTKAKATELLMKYRGYDADKAYWTISGWEYSKTHDGEDGGKMSWFLEAVEKGSGWQARADELLSRGTAKGDIASQITATFKDTYQEVYGTAEGDRLREHLLDVYEYIGYDRDYEWNRYMSKWMDD